MTLKIHISFHITVHRGSVKKNTFVLPFDYQVKPKSKHLGDHFYLQNYFQSVVKLDFKPSV